MEGRCHGMELVLIPGKGNRLPWHRPGRCSPSSPHRMWLPPCRWPLCMKGTEQ